MTTTISNSTSTSAVTTQGIGSGLDIAGIVDRLMVLEQAPLTRLQNKGAAYNTTLSAYGSVASALGTFQTSVAKLGDPAAFSSLTATTSDFSVASIAIDNTKSQSMAVGAHTLNVGRLAASQRTASSAVPSLTTTMGTGTITIDIGTWNSGYSSFTPNGDVGSKSITIDASNNSLSGVRDAINSANAGVTASIVNDGTGNRLVLAGTSTGAANGFRISTADGDSSNLDASGLSQLAFDPAAAGGTPQTRHYADAVNAEFTLDGLPISKASNHVTDAIDGLTIDLKTVSTASSSFTLARDTTTAAANINAFVSSYNTIVKGLSTLTSYNPTTRTAGTLNGDSTMRLISSRLQGMLAMVVPTGGGITTLGDIGIKFGSDGTLTVDSAKLTSALTSDSKSVGRLFATTGAATDALVGFSGSTSKTTPGTYALSVSQLGTNGNLAGSAAAGLTITAGVNDTFSMTIDNVSATMTLSPGTYPDAASLAADVQSRINGTSAFSDLGSKVVVTQTSGVLNIASQRYGSASSVVAAGGNGTANLFGSAPVAAAGADLAGTLDGVAFTGSGQTATGPTGTATEGLKLSINGGATGARGTIAFNRGIAASMNDLLTQFLDPATGIITAATTGINNNIADLKKQEDAWTPRLAAIKARYTAQYNAMDALVASMNSTSSYLTQQLESIASMTSGITSGRT